MDAAPVEDAAVANAGNWLRLVFHSLTCNSPACVLGERCTGGKQLLAHVLSCEEPGACTVASCTSVRRLTLHWLRCQDVTCRLCAGVWRDLSGSFESSGQERAELGQHGLDFDSAPPEAPGTPDRACLPAQLTSQFGDLMAEQNGNAVAPASNLHRGPPPPFRTSAGDIMADRSVLQLQEVTSYMRYLLHGLMCRHAREAPSRAPGLYFWLSVLLPLPPVGPDGAAAAGVPESRTAGQRLLTHRLTCPNSHCALCSGTCDLFTRGNGLRHDLPVPTGLRDMDQIVQELSLALGSVNL